MPKKKSEPESQEAQSERFKEAVRAAVAAGELNPTEADKVMEKILSSSPSGGRKN